MKKTFPALAALLVLTLTGCGTIDDLVGGDEPIGTHIPEKPNGLTPAGTELAIGEWATVPFAYTADAQGVLKVRLTAVDTPSQSDLASFDAATQQKLAGYEARYLRLEIEGISGDDLAYAGVTGNFHPVTDEGKRGQQLNPNDEFTPCNPDSLPADFGPGALMTTCVIGLVGNGFGEIDGAMYSQTDSAYSQYDGKPVVWR